MKINDYICAKLFISIFCDTMEIGSIIRSRRQSLRSTQNALAEMSGVSVRMIKAIEGGYANPSIKTLTKILGPLGLKLQIVDKTEA